MDHYRFREALASRSDGYFELLATAAGDPEATKRTHEGLTGGALTAGAHGPAVAPSLVAERVEALSVASAGRLGALSEGWPAGEDRGPFIDAAWRTALRHLQHLGGAAAERAEALRRQPSLQAEAVRVWGPAAPPPVLEWEDLGAGPSTLDRYRGLAWAPLAEASLTAEDLSAVTPLALRALRGRTTVLDASARAALRKACADLPTDPAEAALWLETSEDVGVLGDIELNQVRDRLILRLGGSAEARNLIPVAYVVLRRGWRVP